MKTTRIGDVVSTTKITVKPKPGTQYWHYSLPAFDAGMKPVYEDGSAIASNKLSVSKGDILCNKLNMKFKRIWRVDADLQNSICSTEFVPIQAVNVDRSFLYYILTSDDFTSKMSGMRTGTSGSHQRVSVDWILDYEFNLPGIETQQRIGALLGQIDSRIRNNAQLNDYLAA